MSDRNEHFTTTGGVPSAPGRYVDVSNVESVQFVPGLSFRPVVGERTMVNFVSFEPNTEAPMHVHEEEQITLVIEGEFEFEIDGEVRTMRAGDLAVIPSWVRHGARSLGTACREIDIFTPPRRSLLEHAGKSTSPPPADAGV